MVETLGESNRKQFVEVMGQLIGIFGPVGWCGSPVQLAGTLGVVEDSVDCVGWINVLECKLAGSARPQLVPLQVA